ncbi:MAG: WYL domain-containing protein [Deltaproteobacteria bacterium]|nr:WYL domain-containing protein [Deltaproteobacteria bacterium]
MRGDQLARQWRLIQRLTRSHYGVGLDDLAGDLEVTRRTVYRDLDALMYAGFPVTSEKRDGRVFYRLYESFELGDAPFTADEVLALAFGEDLLGILQGTVFHDSIRSAMAKVRASLGPELTAFLEQLRNSFRIQPGPHKKYDELRDVIRVFNEAVLEHHTVTMEYQTGRTGEVSVRDLNPYRVWYKNGGLYVIGHDHKSGEVRTFAVDRVREASLSERPFEVPEDFDFDAYTGSSFGVVAEPPESVRLLFEKRWALYVQEHAWHPSQEMTPQEDGRIELRMEVGTGEELTRWVLSFGSGVRVLEPTSLAESLASELRATLARY